VVVLTGTFGSNTRNLKGAVVAARRLNPNAILTDRINSVKISEQTYKETFTKDDLHPGQSLPDRGDLKHNLTANRDPLPEDNYSLGYRENSNWFNQLTKVLFICIESNTFITKWSKVESRLDNLYAKVSGLLQVKESDEEYFIELDVDIKTDVRKVFSVYVLGVCRVLQGWVVTDKLFK
jgi:hypothetical protein